MQRNWPNIIGHFCGLVVAMLAAASLWGFAGLLLILGGWVVLWTMFYATQHRLTAMMKNTDGT